MGRVAAIVHCSAQRDAPAFPPPARKVTGYGTLSKVAIYGTRARHLWAPASRKGHHPWDAGKVAVCGTASAAWWRPTASLGIVDRS
jgi:hypothetical protein